MPRKAKGEITERVGKRGTAYVLRFTAGGKRRHLTVGNTAAGYTRSEAEEELAFVMTQVRKGIWRAPQSAPKIEEPEPEPTFHEFASGWFSLHRGEWKPRTVEDYEITLSNHLIPFFARHRLSEITFEEVGRYVASKVRERTDKLVDRPLSNSTINKGLIRLAAVLDEAVLYGHLATHPLQNKATRSKLRLKPGRPRRASLDARQAAAILEAAGRHRSLIATALMAGGLRVTELTHVRWRDMKLASAKLQVTDSKTDAGIRIVDLEPDLLDVLKEHKARAEWSAPSDFVFPGKRRRVPRERCAVGRLFNRIVKRANKRLIEEGYDPIPDAVTLHSLRRTFATLMAEAGENPSYTMRQIGHSKATFTMEVYTDVRSRQDAGRSPIGSLLAAEMAHNGANGDSGASAESGVPPTPQEKTPL
jgi:integrase